MVSAMLLEFLFVIPANAGIQNINQLVTGLRRCDEFDQCFLRAIL